MPESPLLPSELDDLVDATITDPLLRQNTAAVLRQILKHQNASFLNRLLDGASGGNPPDYNALLQAINGKQTKVRGRLANEYSAGVPEQSLGNLEVILDYLFTHSVGDTSGARDPFDVPTAKRKAVVDANTPALLESNEAYYGCEFVDEVYGPSQPAYYKCMPSAPATAGGATVWKWFRLDIL